MGKLQTAVTLPKRILLQGWALSSFGEDVNGIYTFQNTPSLGSQVTYLPDNQGDGIYPICFFGTSWVIREIGDATQEWRVISTNKVLPLNNWVQVSSAGPAGTITILENISGKNTKISIKKQNPTKVIVSEGSILPPGIDPNGVYLLQNSLINGKSWYIRSNQGINIRIVSSISSIWAMQYLLNNWFPLTSSTNPAANPWEATWPSNIQVSFSNGKISIF